MDIIPSKKEKIRPLKLIDQRDLTFQESAAAAPDPSPQQEPSKPVQKIPAQIKPSYFAQQLKKQNIYYNKLLNQKLKSLSRSLNKKHQYELKMLKDQIEVLNDEHRKEIDSINLKHKAHELHLTENYQESEERFKNKFQKDKEKLKADYRKKVIQFHTSNKKKIHTLRQSIKDTDVHKKQITQWVQHKNSLKKAIYSLKQKLKEKSDQIVNLQQTLENKSQLIQNIKQVHQENTSKLEKEYDVKIHAEKLLYQTQMNQLQNKNLSVKKLQQTRDVEIQAMQSRHQFEIQEIQKDFRAKIYAIQLANKNEIQSLMHRRVSQSSMRDERIERLKQDHKQYVEELEKNFSAKLNAVQLKNTAAVHKIKQDHSFKKITTQHKEQIEELNKHYESKIRWMQSDYEQNTALMKKNYESQLYHLEKEKTQKMQVITNLTEDLDKNKNLYEELNKKEVNYQSKIKQLEHILQEQYEKEQKLLKEQVHYKKLTEEYKKQEEDLKEQIREHQSCAKNSQEEFNVSLAQVKTQYYENKVAIRNQSEIGLKNLKAQFHADKLSWIQKAEKRECTLKEEQLAETTQIKKDFENSLQTLQNSHHQTLQKLKDSHKKDMREVRYDLEEKLKDSKTQYENIIEDLEEGFATRMTELKTSHEKHLYQLSQEMEKALIAEKKKNEELTQLYDRDTVNIQKEFFSLQTKFKAHEESVGQLSSENKVLSGRVDKLLSENQGLKDQSASLQLSWTEMKQDLEAKNNQIQSLQKLNQHISQTLFQVRKKTSDLKKVRQTPRENQNVEKEDGDIISELRLY